jgi:RNA polymerase sigma-70 factor (ECF subfamily)
MNTLTAMMPGLLSTAVLDKAAQAERDDVERARNGDPEAFGRLVERHQQRVFRLAGRFFRRREDVEEAAQDTFLTAWRRLSTYRASAPFEHWLTRVCLNTCYMRLRRARPEEELPRELAAPASTPDARLDAERLLALLPAGDRFLLLMLHGEGWSTAEIAERTGWSQANVKVRAFRARRKLRRLMEGN